MTTAANTQSTEKIDWSIVGMDCASCAAKIRSAVSPVQGVRDVAVSVMNESMTVALEPSAVAIAEIESRVSRLGYKISRRLPAESPASADAGCCAHHDHHESDAAAPQTSKDASERVSAPVRNAPRWFDTPKGRLVAVTGVLLAAAWGAKLAGFETIASWAFVVACVIGAVPIARRAFAALSLGQPFTIEMLMTIAAVGALAIGAAEEAALVIFLFAIGEVLEGVAADRARASIRALGDLIPQTARLIEGTTTREVRAASLTPGQNVLVRPGDRIPADGEIIDGTSEIDESPITGESVPKSKTIADPVFAGSVNRDAALKVRVTTKAEDNTIARIVRLVEESQDAKAPTERFIDRFSRVYMPIIVGLAALVAVIPPLTMGAEWSTWIYRALALLLIGCPCALVISVPASIASSLSAGARRGLLLKGGAVIEAAARTQAVAFDKTGTLTAGTPRVTDLRAYGVGEDDVLALAAAVEAQSSHPLAQAIVKEAERRALPLQAAANGKAIPGRGVEASVAGRTLTIASPRYAAELGALSPEVSRTLAVFQNEGKTAVVAVENARAIGIIACRDEPRPDAKTAIEELDALGISAIMLTGDNAATGKAIGDKIGIEVRAELLPEAKVDAIRAMSDKASVMMVGDGINDAPALATATVGIAMGSGTGVALETADGALMGDRVSDVPRLIRLARATMGNIRQNIALALGLKGVFLVTSVLGLTGLWIAILADTGATVLVTLNALRLLRFNADAR
ncbi:MAG: cadmium-translocating P-type ATPase [Alphaproteobacteria bacterium]|jgi:Zn2+/Cd2+-exporting ATPase|nr:cadmium-translocating P-type ATPase [Alphaproteobacteria bacterium]